MLASACKCLQMKLTDIAPNDTSVIEQHYSPKEAGALLGLCPQQICLMIDEGKFPNASKLGSKTIRIPGSDIRHLLDDCKIRAA